MWRFVTFPPTNYLKNFSGRAYINTEKCKINSTSEIYKKRAFVDKFVSYCEWTVYKSLFVFRKRIERVQRRRNSFSILSNTIVLAKSYPFQLRIGSSRATEPFLHSKQNMESCRILSKQFVWYDNRDSFATIRMRSLLFPFCTINYPHFRRTWRSWPKTISTRTTTRFFKSLSDFIMSTRTWKC